MWDGCERPRPYKWCRFRHRYRIHWSVSGTVYSRLREKDDGAATGGIGRRNVAVAVPRRYLRRADFRPLNLQAARGPGVSYTARYSYGFVRRPIPLLPRHHPLSVALNHAEADQCFQY